MVDVTMTDADAKLSWSDRPNDPRTAYTWKRRINDLENVTDPLPARIAAVENRIEILERFAYPYPVPQHPYSKPRIRELRPLGGRIAEREEDVPQRMREMEERLEETLESLRSANEAGFGRVWAVLSADKEERSWWWDLGPGSKAAGVLIGLLYLGHLCGWVVW